MGMPRVLDFGGFLRARNHLARNSVRAQDDEEYRAQLYLDHAHLSVQGSHTDHGAQRESRKGVYGIMPPDFYNAITFTSAQL